MYGKWVSGHGWEADATLALVCVRRTKVLLVIVNQLQHLVHFDLHRIELPEEKDEKVVGPVLGI